MSIRTKNSFQFSQSYMFIKLLSSSLWNQLSSSIVSSVLRCSAADITVSRVELILQIK